MHSDCAMRRRTRLGVNAHKKIVNVNRRVLNGDALLVVPINYGVLPLEAEILSQIFIFRESENQNVFFSVIC